MPQIALREAAYAAIAARLTVRLPKIPVERNRRSMVSDQEVFPLLVLRDGSQQPPEVDAAGEDAWDVSAFLEGYVLSSDANCGPEASDLYARAADALFSDVLVLDATLPGGVPVEITLIEGPLDFDAATVAESSQPIAAFYLELSFQVRVPAGTRFLETA